MLMLLNLLLLTVVVSSQSNILPSTTFPVILNTAGQSFTLDYGSEVAGTPYFKISNVDRAVQIEVRYSEELHGLDQPLGDGPFPFALGLSGTYRTETFNITSAGSVQSFFIQGGQRWQSIIQLTEGSLTLAEVGFIPSADLPDVNTLPGSFECSNPAYNAIWQLGARASSAACVDADTQNATWVMTLDGALIHGQKPAPSAVGTNFVDYSLSFSTKIIRGGTGWAIAQTGSSSGLQLLLTSDLPEESTFINTNTTITPPNTIVLAYGFSFVNQTTLPSAVLDSFKLPSPIQEGQWYDIETSFYNGTTLSASVDGTQIFKISLTDYGISFDSPDPTAKAGAGSWGFGPWQDQIALYKDVIVTAENGTLLYENALTSEDVLSEYGVARNNATVCLDGPKRDRLVWLGDAFHTTRIIPASTARRDHVLGTLQYLLDWQNEEGLLPIAPPMGYDPIYASTIGAYRFLLDYQALGLLGYTGYFSLTGDLEFAKQLWPGFQKQISWLTSQINATTGLADIGGFTGPASGTATSAQLVQALSEAAVVARALGDTASADNYTMYALKVADAVETLLWNETLGVYVLSLDASSNYSVAGISFAITSGIAARNATRLASLISALEELKLGPGYKDSTATSSTDLETNISPNINGFLLSALLQANATEQAKFLLDNLWTAMISNDSTTTGASWEYVNAFDLSPGLGLFTSLSHPWGGAPTYIMPQWIAGARHVTAGYEEWKVVPGIDGFDVNWASTTVPTQYGELSVRWEVSGNVLNVNITAPVGTSGSFALPSGQELGSWSVNGKYGQGGSSIQLGAGNSTIKVSL